MKTLNLSRILLAAILAAFVFIAASSLYVRGGRHRATCCFSSAARWAVYAADGGISGW